MKPDHLQYLIGRVEGALIALNAPQLILDNFKAIALQLQAPPATDGDTLPALRKVVTLTVPDEATEKGHAEAMAEYVAKVDATFPTASELKARRKELASAACRARPAPGEEPAGDVPTQNNRRWPQWQKDKLVEMKRSGESTQNIAKALGRSPSQVNYMYFTIRQADPAASSIPRQPRGRTRKGGSWGYTGRAPEAPPPGEITTYTDEHGQTVKQCPTAYAHGVFPERSARPKGGA